MLTYLCLLGHLMHIHFVLFHPTLTTSTPTPSGYDYKQAVGVPPCVEKQFSDSTHGCMCTRLRSTASASSVDVDVLDFISSSSRSRYDAPLAQADACAVVLYGVHVAAYMHLLSSCSVCLWGNSICGTTECCFEISMSSGTEAGIQGLPPKPLHS